MYVIVLENYLAQCLTWREHVLMENINIPEKYQTVKVD